ncbi:hypothetical protein AJ80_05348 [Polytolypa hystricis UAMH7299]|uniref:Polysaccharide export protein n=1 Tax=Polytolypa hystricis (strain UAMH7299) TaxID=1447883 RepID=A0A2B7Y527_POLH7|nr:hypothetical protein AJ80_05348 [Polytolypa hystricis UAMH7299]
MVLYWRARSSVSRRQLRRRLLAIFLFIFIVWNAVEVYAIRYRLIQADTLTTTAHDGGGDGGAAAALAKKKREGESVFIASTHWNNERILRSHWNAAVLELVTVLGPENVFVSVLEGGSWDDSKGALRELDAKLADLGVQRSIVLEDETHQDHIEQVPVEQREGWIDTPRGKRELRRIPYLAGLRNRSLKPLEELAEKGVGFDRVLFLNDVVFTTNDVLNLINTKDGDYSAACALDFSSPPLYYDTFALRDSGGHEHIMQSWPYFRSSRSRNALKAMLPVPVTSCWNGIVSMPASPFLAKPPLRFRGVSDSLALSHLEGSECCLIHADSPLSKQKGIYLNPNVRVGYNEPAYTHVHPARNWLSSREILWSLWENRLRRWTTTQPIKEWAIWWKLRKWERGGVGEEKGRKEPGGFCLVNEMQVLVANGWAHV